jgi:TonB-linked SusC/RagA family outer membrane protein
MEKLELTVRGDSFYPLALKIKRIMKLTLIISLIGIYQAIAISTYSQTAKLSLTMENARIKDVLTAIEEQSEFFFLYSSKLVDVEKNVTVKVDNKKIEEILTSVFKGSGIDYIVMDRQIILSPSSMMAETMEMLIQQQRTVSGVVSDKNNQPLPGVTVVVKGTAIGTVTDGNGNYSLANVSPNSSLVFSFVGMRSQEISVGDRTNINVALQEETIGIEEVVAIGYGTQKKVNLTGSVSSVSAEELTKRPVVNPVLMLQGKVPGIQIIQNSGAPGNEAATIQIRGRRSFGTGNEPLVLIDGVQGSLTQLNPNMIESISILKDASSSAIYGSRAANGVILVTTKRGTTNNRLNIEYHYNYGLQQPTFLPELITNSAEYMTLLNEASMNTRGRTIYTQAEIDLYKNNVGNPMYPNTDWNKYIYKDGSTQSHYLSLNGGNETTNYNFGLGYVDQIGVVQHYDAKKYNILFNMSSSLSKVVSFNVNFNLSQNKRNESQGGVTNLVLTTWGAHPTYGPRIVKEGPSQGMYTRYAFGNVYNNWQPTIAAENGGDLYQTNHAHLSGGINVKIIEGLNWETTGAARLSFDNFKSTGYSIPTYDWFTGNYVASIQPTNIGIAVTRRDTKDQFYNLFSTLKYDKLFAEKHQVDGLLGYSQENLRNDFLQGYRRNMASATATEINSGGSLGQTTAGNAFEWAIQSLFGRINYAYNDKYLFEVSFRYDGSSRFSEGNKWGMFPSLSAGWRINNETFLSSLSWINELKLRASWGKLGNQEIGNYPYQEIMTIGLNYPWASSVQSGAYLSRLSNNDITWETTTITDIGLDFSFFDNRFYGTLDYFDKVTTDILRSAQVPGLVGLSAPTINQGAMKNEGFEFLIGHKNRIGDLSYDISFNLGTYKNTLTKFGARQDGGTFINEEGLPWNSYYAWKQIGIFQSQAEIDAAPVHQFNPKPGDFRYEDVNDDKKIDQNDRVVIPGIFPKFDYGGSINLEWKNFDLTAFFQGSEGKKYSVIFWGIEPFFQEGKPPTFWRNRWTPEKPSTVLPRLYIPGEHPAITNFSSWWLQDASYLRLKNVQLGYNISEEICNRIGIKGIRVYYSGDNLLTFTQYYKGITGADKAGGDPERITGAGNQWFANYPQVITHSFGIKLNF